MRVNARGLFGRGNVLVEVDDVPVYMGGAQFLAATLFDSQGYKFAQDPSNWDNSQQAYGAGASTLARGAQQGLTGAQGDLVRMGLGRSGAMAAVANQSAQQLAGQQANLRTQLYQQGLQNRLAGARQAFDMDQQIMRWATGLGTDSRVVERREPSAQAERERANVWGAVSSLAGQAIGTAVGGFAGGGFGGGGGAPAAPTNTGPMIY